MRLRDAHESRWDGLVRDFRSLGCEPVAVHIARPRRDARRVPSLGRPAPDVARSGRVKRLLLAAVACSHSFSLHPPCAGLPIFKNGSSVGEGLAAEGVRDDHADVHLFGDSITAKLAIVADTKWVDPARLQVNTDFAPYEQTQAPTILRASRRPLRAGDVDVDSASACSCRACRACRRATTSTSSSSTRPASPTCARTRSPRTASTRAGLRSRSCRRSARASSASCRRRTS